MSATVYWQAFGESEWNQLPSDCFRIRGADGVIEINHRGYLLLPEKYCLAIDAEWIDRTSPTSAEMLKGMVAGLGVLDTVRPDMAFVAGHTFGRIGYWTFGWGAMKLGGVHGYKPVGNPSANGIPDGYVLGGTGYPFGDALSNGYSFTDPAIHNFQIRENVFNWEEFVAGPNFSIGASNNGAFDDGTGAGWLRIASYKIPTVSISMGLIASKFPKDTEILEASIECRAPATMNFQSFTGQVVRMNETKSPANRAFTSVSSPTTTENTTTMSNVGWMLVGELNTGMRVPLGTFTDDSGAGSLSQNKWRVVGFKKAFEKILSLRNSPYRAIHIIPGSFGGRVIVPQPHDPLTSDPMIEMLRGILDGWSSAECVGAGGIFPLRYWDVAFSGSYLTMSGNLQLGAPIIKFKLPDSVVKTQRLTYGNWPGVF